MNGFGKQISWWGRSSLLSDTGLGFMISSIRIVLFPKGSLTVKRNRGET